jgi:hypothetical protein
LRDDIPVFENDLDSLFELDDHRRVLFGKVTEAHARAALAWLKAPPEVKARAKAQAVIDEAVEAGYLVRLPGGRISVRQ